MTNFNYICNNFKHLWSLISQGLQRNRIYLPPSLSPIYLSVSPTIYLFIYCKELGHKVMEAEESQNLQLEIWSPSRDCSSSPNQKRLRTRRANGVSCSLKTGGLGLRRANVQLWSKGREKLISPLKAVRQRSSLLLKIKF